MGFFSFIQEIAMDLGTANTIIKWLLTVALTR